MDIDSLEGRELDSAVAEFFFKKDPAVARHIPQHYSSDYNACRKIEDEIERRGRWEIYLHYLLYELNVYEGYEGFSEEDIWKCMRATPEQRCRAALKMEKGGG